jgi:hypothetical protein
MAYKTFANGFPLPASDLNNFLMNQSVIVFADAAARTTAIPSPITGMLTYLEDTSAYESWNGSAFVNINDNTDAIPKSTVTTAQDLIVADGASSVTRLGVGTDDQVLSVVAGAVAWADAGGGGGLEQISSVTLSGSAVTFTSIPQTYKSLYLTIVLATSDFSVGASAFTDIRINSDSSTNYAFVSFESSSANSSFNRTGILPYNFTSNSTGFLVTATFPAYTTAIRKYGQFTHSLYDGSLAKLNKSQGMSGITAAISSLTIVDTAGNNYTGGTATLYGVN